MEFGKACYSYASVQNCMEKVKELPAVAVNRKQPKKELDRLYRACIRFLKNELNGILSLMESGEVDSKA